MTDQTNELRRINWSECFPFTNIFKTFRIAVSPTKLGLALAALILTGLSGKILDAIWTGKNAPVTKEVDAYWQVSDVKGYREAKRQAQAAELGRLYQEMGGVPADKINKAVNGFATDPSGVVREALDELKSQYRKATEKLGRSKDDQQQIALTAAKMNGIHRDLESLRPQGIFWSFLSYETSCVRQMLDAARVLNFTGQLNRVITSRSGGLKGIEASGMGSDSGIDPSVLEVAKNLKRAMVKSPESPEVVDVTLLYPSVKTGPTGIGVLPSIFLMLRGFQWLFVTHWFFAILFLLISLAIWSLFGGAIARVAALNFAKDERIGAKVALAFAGRKFLGFFAAPLLPILMVAGVAVCLVVGGLFLAIPYVGEVFGGLLLGLALLGGFVITLVVFGALGGFGMMWPTVAVEGSDAFDAVSRSYSYLYSRPWRAAFYAVVATVYGSFCYLFARFFVLVLLKSTRLFVGWGAAGTSRPGTGNVNASKLDAIWPPPSFESMYASIPPFGCEHWDRLGAILIAVWLILLTTLLCAYLASFFLSGSTIIYYLLRREVDATDFSEVFVEGEPDLATEGGAYQPAPAPAAPQPPPTPPEPEQASGGSPSGSPENPAS